MMYIKQLSTLLLLFTVGICGAQNGILNGTVSDEDGEPIIHAQVIANQSLGLTTVTDFDGFYSLELPSGVYSVVFEYLGMSTDSVEVTITANETLTQDFMLREESTLINTIVVSASKYEKKLSEETVSIEVVGSELLENNNIVDAEESLRKVPGVSIVDGQANIRGGSGWAYGAGSRVLVLYDDIPLLSADAGDAKWSLVPMENLETVEVIKGAASSIYGSGALNGVVNFRTGYPSLTPETKLNVWMTAMHAPRNKEEAWWYGNNALPFSNGMNFMHKRKHGRSDFVWHGQYQQERDDLQDGSFGNIRVGQKYRFRPRKIEGMSVGVNFNGYRSWGSNFFLWNGLGDQMRVAASGTSSRYQSTRIIIDPFITYFDKNKNRYSLKTRWFNSTNESTDGQGSRPNNYFSELQYSRYFDELNFNVVAGLVSFADIVRAPRGLTADSSLVGEHNRYNVAPYAQLEKKLFNQRLNLTLGMRYEYFTVNSISKDTSFNSSQGSTGLKRPLFRVGMNYQAAEYTFIRGSWGEGYRFPNLAESFTNLSLGGINIFPNPKLTSERGWYAEVGIKQGFRIGKGWQGYMDLSAFGMYYDNMIEINFGQFGEGGVFDPSDLAGFLQTVGFSFQNVGETRIIGSEFTIVGQGNLTKNVPMQILFGYTYTDPKSMNWDEEITLYNTQGQVVNSQIDINQENSNNRSTITYAETSSSNENVLKYRNKHILALDWQIGYKRFDFGLSVQHRSFMENIDYPFVGDLFVGTEASLFNGGQPFGGIRDFRSQNFGIGNTVIDTRMIYAFSDFAKVSFLVKNVMNKTYVNRPGLPEDPLNFTFRFSYTFKG
ncbi:MAG TPA: hypothetical protein DEO99_05865 [Bacteroidetes bacterium]|nr:hypothetical protein [Bacteroidota bacterium]